MLGVTGFDNGVTDVDGWNTGFDGVTGFDVGHTV